MRQKLTISLLLLLLLAPQAKADVVVILRRQAEAAGSYVRVCDVARVEGPKDQAVEVGMTVLGPTPAKGETRSISRWEVESRLHEMGVAANVTFSGNDAVEVFGDGLRSRRDADDANLLTLNPLFGGGPPDGGKGQYGAVDSGLAARAGTGRNAALALDGMTLEARDRVRQAVSLYLAGRYDRPDIDVEAKLLFLSEPVPFDAYEVVVEEALDGRVPGKATLRLRMKETAASEPKRLTVSADTEVYAPTLVASRPLQRGDILDKRDVAVNRVKMESGQGYFAPNPEAVAGRELKKALPAGTPILAADAVPGEAVKRGTTVIVDTSGPGWRVQAKGKALGGGMVGEEISVEDSSTKARFRARITGPNTVAVVGKEKK